MTVETDRLISAKPSSPQDEQFERSLRPATLAEYVGQEKARGQLEIFIQAARRRGEALDSLALLMGVEAQDRDAFNRAAKSNMGRIFAKDGTPEIMAALRLVLANDAQLARYTITL